MALQVLAHASVRAVVSHCGLAGAQEALYYGKPVLCLPRFGDQVRAARQCAALVPGLQRMPHSCLPLHPQPDVAARVLDHGVGLSVDKASFAAATSAWPRAAACRGRSPPSRARGSSRQDSGPPGQ